MLSRAHGGFMASCSPRSPEVYDGVIEIRAIARDPQPRQDAVVSNDSSIDPSALRRMRGSRVQAVVPNCKARRSTSSLVAGRGRFWSMAGAGEVSRW